MEPATNGQSATNTSLSLAQVVAELKTITGDFSALLTQVEQVVTQADWLRNLIAENAPTVDFPASDFAVTTNGDGLQQVKIQENRIKDILVSLGVSTGGGTGTAPAANNLFSSIDLGDASWRLSDMMPLITGQPNYTTSSTTAYFLRPNSQETDNHNFYNFVRVPVEDAKSYRISIRMKGNGIKKVSLLLVNSSDNLIGSPVVFDLEKPNEASNDGSVAVNPLGNGWAEYSFRFTPSGATQVAAFFKPWATAVNIPYQGDGTIGVYAENPSFVKL